MKRSHDVDFDALFDSLRDEHADSDDAHRRAAWDDLEEEEEHSEE